MPCTHELEIKVKTFQKFLLTIFFKLTIMFWELDNDSVSIVKVTVIKKMEPLCKYYILLRF